MSGVMKKFPVMSKASYEKVAAAGYKEDHKQFRSETGAKVPLVENRKETEDAYVNSYLDWKKGKPPHHLLMCHRPPGLHSEVDK